MYDMHLIINTHWDREYRWSFSETQYRLAEAVDDLINIMQNDKNFTYFHTDSQVSFLDDYLEIRPERTEEVKALVKEGRILTGPWYTLPAEYLVSGEALVRNLLMGHKLSKNLGKVMKAAYNIFSWGQISQLPQIYHQFGMDTIVFYRGIDQGKLDKLEFRWRSPDGTEALGITFGAYHRLNFWRYVYLPYILGGDSVSGDNHKISRNNLGEGYLFHVCSDNIDEVNHTVINQSCARDIKGAIDGMEELMGTVKDISSTNHLLFLQGFDQENPDPIVTELLEKINKQIDYGTIKVSSLEEYMRIVHEELKEKGIYNTLPLREGEMLEIEKNHDAFGPLYNGVFAARMPVKLKNAKAKYLIEGWAEPSAVFSMILGNPYPTVTLTNAWKEILKNQQHDGIGGCHVDRVTKTMEERYENAIDIGNTVMKTSLRDLNAQIDYSFLKEQEIGVTVYNSTQFVRTDKVHFIVDIPHEWGFKQGTGYKRDFMVKAFDTNGAQIDCQIIFLESDTVYGYLKFGNVIGYDSERVSVILNAENIPPFGYKSFIITPVHGKYRPVEMLSYEPNVLENTKIKATINTNGTIDLEDKVTGKVLHSIHYFEDVSDKGGPPFFDMTLEKGLLTTLTEKPEIMLINNGPLYTKYRITYDWMLPEGLDSEMKVHVPHGSDWVDYGNLRRSARRKAVRIVSDVVLKKDSNQLEFTTTVDNTVLNHRLRAMFPTGYESATESIADIPFDVVKRTIAVEDSTGWYEEAARTWPSTSFVSVGDDTSSALLIHNGTPEYEVTDTKSRTIGLTLLRAIGTAGNPTETYRYQELAQCLGKHTYRYVISVKAPETEENELLKDALTFNIPLNVSQTTKHKGSLGTEKAFFRISDDHFVVTAVKRAEGKDGIVIRGYNLSNHDIAVDLTCDFPVKSASKMTLEEIETAVLPVSGGKIKDIKIGKREIASIYIEL